MLEDQSGHEAVPHRADRIIIPPALALCFQRLHERFVRKRLEGKVLALQVRAGIDLFPREQLRLRYNSHVERFSACYVGLSVTILQIRIEGVTPFLFPDGLPRIPWGEI